MAYGLKYFSEFSDVEEIGYRIEIHERDYSGDSLEIISSGSPFVLEVMDIDNIFAPIRTKKATIEWTVTDEIDFEIKDLELNDDQRYKVFFYEIKEGDILVNKFTGYLVTVDCKEPFGSKPYHIQLSAACGLFFLRDNYFTSDGGEFVLDKINIKDTIGQCLQFTNLDLDFHTYVDLYDIQMAGLLDDPLYLADFAADGLRGLNCYDALSGVLNAINAFVVQEGDIWVIKGIPDSSSLECPRRIYDFQGVFKSSNVVNQVVSIGKEPFNDTIPNVIPTDAVTTSIAETSSVIKQTISPGIAVNRLRNGQFAYPIFGGNMTGWNIDLDDMRYPSGGLESKGWERTGFGTIDSPYRFVMRGTVRPGNKNDYDINISTTDPIIIDAGLFDKNQKVKIVVSGAFRSRDILQLDIACRLNDGDRDYVDWLDVSGKWNQSKKSRTHIINKVDSNNITDITIPIGDLPLQTFEIKSEIITNYLNRNVGGLPHSIAKLYFSVYPGVEIPKNPGKAPLLALEDFAVSVTTETIYEGDHTYVVDADLPIRNANEINYTSIVADKINIITPEQVRLENRVMTGYMTIHDTDNLTYGWKRRIGGLPDPTGDNFLPIQFKVLKERIRQVCGKRIIVEGDFLGYDLNASNSVFLQYDDVYNEDKFYTITNWKWDVINRRYTIKLNELSLIPLTNQQEFVELDKDGSSNRGNRLYGGASGSSSSSNGGGTPDIPDPIVLDPFDPLYFVVGTTTTQSFDIGALITSSQLPEELTAIIAYRPSWMLAPYEDRGIDGDLLTFTVTGTPTETGHEQILIELTDLNNTKDLAVVPIIMQPKTTNVNQVLDGTTLDILGVVPGFFPLPDLFNFRSKIVGTHDKIEITVIGGGTDGGSFNETTTREVTLADTANYLLFDTIDGVVVDPGVYNYEVVTYRGTLETSREEGSFTLYDEEYIAKASFELYDTTKAELIGIIDIEGNNQYKKPESFDVKTIISDLNHDKVNFTLKKDGVQIYTVEYPVDPAVTDAEYYLFGSIVTTYGSGKYDLIVDVSLLGAPVYQRLSSFEILDEEVEPEAGVDLIEFKENTINYSVVTSLPLFNYQADLPSNWGLKIPVPAIDYDYVEWKLYDSTSGGLVDVDIEAYTNLPQYKSFSDDPEPILVFGLKNSTNIGDIHRAPSSFRLKAIFKLGGDSGDVVAIKQADFSFRVPLEPEDYSGNRFIQINDSDSSVSIIDANMPKTGSKYIFPDQGVRWSVSSRSFNGGLFDKIVVKLSKLIGSSYVVLHKDGADYISEFNSGTDIVETPSELSAYITGLLNGDNLRYLYSPSMASIIIDEIGSYKASFDYYLDSVLLGTSETQFDLIDKTIPDIPIKDCCGGSGSDLPVYPVEGVWGGNNKLLQVALTENGTVSAIEESNLDGVSIVDDVWTFTYPPKSATVASVNDELVNYGQLIEAVAAGGADKEPVKTIATSNITLSGNQIINGYSTVTGDRVLVANQTDPKENGSYVAVAGAWNRSTDADTGIELIGATYLVTDGDATVIGTKWKVVNTPPIVLGTDNINIVKIQGAETDPTVGAWIKAITAAQITNWDTAYTGYVNFNSMFDTRFGDKTTNNLVEGTINKYFTEQRVRDTPLTGLAISNSAITATDTVIIGFGKIQGQLTNHIGAGGAAHANATTSVAGFMSAADKIKLDASVNYVHPTGDGNLHVPATGTTSNGKFLKAGATAGSLSWALLTESDIPSLTISKIDGLQPTLDAKQSALSGTGIVKSTAGVISYLTDNSANWNTAFGWGDFKLRSLTIAGTSGRITSSAGAQTLASDRTWTLDLATTGVTANTYKSVSVDIYGRITAGTNPTTLAGYGITDAASSASLSGYVQIGTSNNITADHNFTGLALKMSQHYFHNTFDGSNVYVHYYPSNAGNGATSSYANFRVWDGPGNTLKTLRIGGNGTFTWDEKNVATENWVIAQDRFVSSLTPVSDLNNVINGGVKYWMDSAANKPEGYGSVMTFAGFSSTGNVTNGGWISQIMSGTSGAWYVRLGGGIAGPAANWGSTYQLWTTKQFSQADITNWNTAFGWGNHAGLYSLLGHTHTFASLTSKPTTLAGYGITDAASVTDLSSYVSKTVADNISASHNFTGTNLSLPGQTFHNLFPSTNLVLLNYYPIVGASVNTFAHFRVWDVYAETQKVLRIGGDGTFTWDGNNVITSPMLTSALIAKEDSFSKGNLVQGAGVNLSGTLTNRLVGSGNITISASSVGSWQDSLGVSAIAVTMPIISRGNSTSVLDYLQFKPTDYGVGKPYLAISKHFTPNKWEFYTYDGVSTTGSLNFALNLTRFDVNIVDENRSVLTGAGLTGGGTLAANRTLSVVFGSESGTVAQGDDSRINNGQTAFGWGNHAGLYVRKATADTITAAHIFTGGITMPGTSYNNTYDGSNIYRHYAPEAGNGSTVTIANLRVWNGAGGYKALRFGGDGIMTWDGNNVATQSWVTSNTVPQSRTLTINGTSYDLSANRSWTISGGGGGTVTSVGLTVPGGFYVTSSPVTGSGNLSFEFSAGYFLPTTSNADYWNSKLNNDKTIGINGTTYYVRDNPNFTGIATTSDLSNYLPVNKTITINGSTQNLNSNPNFTISGGGGISGGGTSGYVPLWNSGSNIVNSYLRAQSNGTTGDSIYGRFSMDIQADKTGYPGFIVSDTSYSASGEVTALVQFDSQTRGLLGPRMTYAQRTAIASPAAGLQVFQTNSGGAGIGFYGYTGSAWVLLG